VIKKVLLACCDMNVRQLISNSLLKLMPESSVLTCKNDAEMYAFIKEAENTAIIFDKFFLGYVLSYQILRLKIINDKILAYFAETGDCSKYFGLRVHNLGINGLISHIEKKDCLKKALQTILTGTNTFPEVVTRSIEDNDYLLDKKSYSEVTEREMAVGMYLGMGKTQKEISYLTGMSTQAICIHVHRLRRKIGYKMPSDYEMLNKVALKEASRSVYC
jgi:DNA-binding NarL/FixJ family response regulator